MAKINIMKQKEIKRGKSDLYRIYPEWGIRIDQTPCGLGLFALRDFAAGERIGPIAGIFLRETDYDSEYSIDAGYPFILEPFPPFCYLNHCCDPNTIIIRLNDNDQDPVEESITEIQTIDGIEYEISHCSRISCIGCPDARRCRSFQLTEEEMDPEFRPEIDLQVEAVRSIPKGDQITIDYAWPASMAIPCRCGSPGCRGWIVDPNELDRIPLKGDQTQEL